jgi:hypothetical protein
MMETTKRGGGISQVFPKARTNDKHTLGLASLRFFCHIHTIAISEMFKEEEEEESYIN